MSRHIVITAQGTGADMWLTAPPQPAAVAAALDPALCFWQPLGNYPASVTNPQMGASVQDGVNEMVRLVNQVYTYGNPTGSTIIPIGYSQGAIVVGHWWRDEVLNPAGRCHARAADVIALAVWGNPLRCPGFTSGNDFAGWPKPTPLDGVTTGGIAGPDCLKPDELHPQFPGARHFFGDFVNTIGQGRDLYADAPVGPPAGQPVTPAGDPWAAEPDAGVYETQIYNIIQNAFPSIFTLAADIFHLFGPAMFREVLGIAEAVINGGLFLSKGPNAAHYTYDITPIVNFVNLAAHETPPH
jgi:hypothetical protein